MFRSRWRRWVRERTPDVFYNRGLIVPKVSDCRNHEWYRSTELLDACYHCEVTRASADAVLANIRERRRGIRLGGLSIPELIDEGRR